MGQQNSRDTELYALQKKSIELQLESLKIQRESLKLQQEAIEFAREIEIKKIQSNNENASMITDAIDAIYNDTNKIAFRIQGSRIILSRR